MPQLRYIDDAGTIRTLALGSEPLLIGRVNTCKICFADDMVSREHTRIERQPDGRYRIRDLASRNKTHVNGEQAAEALLQSGDVIRVGEHVIEFLDADYFPETLTAEFLTPDTREPDDCHWVKIKAPISLTLQQVERLSALSTNWGITSRPEDIADACLSKIIVEMQADRGFMALRGEQKHAIKPIAHRGMIRQVGGSLTPVSQTFVSAALLQNVAGRYPQSARKVNPDAGYAPVAAVAPLTYRGTPTGVVYVDRTDGRPPFTASAQQYCWPPARPSVLQWPRPPED